MEKIEEKYQYINISPKSRQKLNTIMEEIEKLNTAKKKYSIQELQSMNILEEDKEKENQRILEELEGFLGKATNIQVLGKSNAQNEEIRNTLEGALDKKEVWDKIDINLSNFKSTTYTLLDLAFKSNKYTKWLCEDAIELLKDNNSAFEKILREMRSIYYKENNLNENSNNNLQELAKKIKEGKFKGWAEKIKGEVQDNEIEKVITILYNDLQEILDLQQVLYEIKSQLNKQVIKCLIKDYEKKESEFNWGFSFDPDTGNNGTWVLNIDSDNITERYAFHVPNLGKILSGNLIDKITGTKITGTKITEPKIFKCTNHHITSSVRKNNIDKLKSDNRKFDDEELMKNIINDIINRKLFSRDKIDPEQYVTAKFMGKESLEIIEKEHPELKTRCEELKELIYPEKTTQIDDEILQELEKNTQREYQARKQIESNLKEHKRIYVQYGENLDKNASLYALKKHMKKLKVGNIEVIEINAGESRAGILNKGIFLDAGFLKGCTSMRDYKSSKEINANEARAQKSTCGVLSQYGIYVPKKIVQHADEIINDERSLDARYGLHLCRKLKNKKLFEFAEAKREDGTYLIEATLTDDELNEWKLFDAYEEREKEIKKDTKTIAENMYEIEENGTKRYIAVVDKYVNCGSWIAYSLGCDYYLSIADKNAQFTTNNDLYGKEQSRATFSMLANPNKGNGQIPENVIKWCEELRNNGENATFKMTSRKDKNKVSQYQKPFIAPKKDKVIFGGLKTPNLFIELKDEKGNVVQALFDTMKNLIGFEPIEKQEKTEVIKNETATWKYKQAKEIVSSILNEMTLTQVYQTGDELLDLANGRGEDIDINRN